MLSEKVVQLNQNNVYDQIQKFLKKKGYKSQNTMTSYQNDIKRFFKLIKKKELPFLTELDVQITLDDFEEFIAMLYDKGELNNKTINRNVVAVKQLLKYLCSKKIIDDITYLNQIVRLPEKKNKYGILTVDEVLTMAKLALNEREKGLIKSKLILFALDTCIRQNAILNIKWSDFDEREDGVKINVVDKGNKDVRTKIAKWFYEDILILKNEESEFVFNIDDDTISRMMKRLKEKMNIKPERRIVFHSIRKAGATFQYRLTGDILQAKKVLNHSSVTTTQDYLEDEDYGVVGAVSTMRGVNAEDYKKASYDELVSAIDKLPKSTQLLIALKLKELKTK